MPRYPSQTDGECRNCGEPIIWRGHWMHAADGKTVCQRPIAFGKSRIAEPKPERRR